MISKLTLRSFQIHEQLDIEFEPVTTFVGKTDSGKSAIIRALKWIATNKPSGSAFITDGTENVKVSVVIDNQIVKRRKGKGGNKYQIGDKKLLAFNQDVPEDVADLFNIDPDLNFQSQHTSPFWFSESAGEVSRNLNQIINLGAIDSVLANLNQRVRENNAQIEVSKGRLLAAKGKRAELLEVENQDSALKLVEHKEQAFEKTRLASILMHDLLQRVLEGRRTSKRAAGLEHEGQVVLEKGVSWEKTKGQGDRLRSLIRQVEAKEQDKLMRDNTLAELQKKWTKETKGTVCPICNQILK